MTVLLIVCLLVSACKEPLYSDLDENQANEMVAILQAADIEAGRDRDKDGRYTITVLPDDVGVAVTLLRAKGYPLRQFATLGEVFPNEGMVGTPFEERARFMYALNEELSHTISDIAGVRQARVQVIIPPAPRFGETVAKSSAAIAVYYETGVELSHLVPVIKSLVAHSVPHLEYDAVEVALLMAGGTKIEAVAPEPVDSVASGQPTQAMMVPLSLSPPVVAGVALLLALSLLALLLFRRGGGRR